MSLEEVSSLRNQQTRVQQHCVREICSASNINFSRQRGSRSHGCLAASVRHHPVLPAGRLCRGNDVHISSTEGDVAAEGGPRKLHERQQAQRRKLKTLCRRCIRIHHRLQECEDAYNSDMSPGNWYCGPSLSTQGSGTEDEEVNDEVGAPHTCRNSNSISDSLDVAQYRSAVREQRRPPIDGASSADH